MESVENTTLDTAQAKAVELMKAIEKKIKQNEELVEKMLSEAEDDVLVRFCNSNFDTWFWVNDMAKNEMKKRKPKFYKACLERTGAVTGNSVFGNLYEFAKEENE